MPAATRGSQSAASELRFSPTPPLASFRLQNKPHHHLHQVRPQRVLARRGLKRAPPKMREKVARLETLKKLSALICQCSSSGRYSSRNRPASRPRRQIASSFWIAPALSSRISSRLLQIGAVMDVLDHHDADEVRVAAVVIEGELDQPLSAPRPAAGGRARAPARRRGPCGRPPPARGGRGPPCRRNSSRSCACEVCVLAAISSMRAPDRPFAANSAIATARMLRCTPCGILLPAAAPAARALRPSDIRAAAPSLAIVASAVCSVAN